MKWQQHHVIISFGRQEGSSFESHDTICSLEGAKEDCCKIFVKQTALLRARVSRQMSGRVRPSH